MSHKEKMAELRQILERWNSHNEVHARPTDKMLYEFLNGLLKQLEDEPEKDTPVEDPQVVATAEGDPPGEGSNSPEGTPDLP